MEEMEVIFMSGMIFLFMAWGAWITATFILDKKRLSVSRLQWGH